MRIQSRICYHDAEQAYWQGQNYFFHTFKINHSIDNNFTRTNRILFINYSFAIHSTLFTCCSTRSNPLKPYILTYTNAVSTVNMIDTIKNTLFLSINTLRIKITPISISSVAIKCDRLKTINKTPTKKRQHFQILI